VSAKRDAEKKSEGPKPEAKDAFADMCLGLMSGEMPECCRPMMRTMMSRWAGAFSPVKRP
jgi:hypothetical protein